MFGGVDKVDRRGRKVNQTSSEDLRKYYELDGRCLYDRWGCCTTPSESNFMCCILFEFFSFFFQVSTRKS